MADQQGSNGGDGQQQSGQQQGSGDGGQQQGQQQKQGADGGGYTPPASQADLDRIINDRLARERAKYSDYTDLKKKAEAHDKALADAQSDQDKAVNKAREEGKAEAQAAANARLVAMEVRAQAATAKFRDPSDAIAQLRSEGKLDDIKVAADGEPDADAIKVLLDDLAKAKPYLVAEDQSKPPPSFNGGPRQSDNKPDPTPGLGRLRTAYTTTSKR